MNNSVLEQLKEEYNEALNRAHDLGEIIARCTDVDTHHCGVDADADRPKTISFVDDEDGETIPESIMELIGDKVAMVLPDGFKCEECASGNHLLALLANKPCDCKKVELVGGYYLCLAPQR